MRRLRAMIVKEIWAVLRDPKTRIVLVVPPFLQLFIFAFATTLDVKNAELAVLDRSGGRTAVELVQRIEGSPNIHRVRRLASEADLAEAINDQHVIAALVIPEGFDRDVAAARPATFGLVLDGRRSNAAQILAGYVQQSAAGFGAELKPQVTKVAGSSEVT